MNIEKPAYTTIEIEQMRSELNRVVSNFGMNSLQALMLSRGLDKIMNKMSKTLASKP